MSCESGNNHLIEVALDCFTKLIEHGYINGGEVTTKVVNMIKLCHEKTKDDNVHQHILKLFLVVIATPACKIHDNNLLTIIKVCYNIYLKTSNPDNMRTAKTTLLDILKLLFSRLEESNTDDKGGYTTAYNDCYQVFKGLCKYAMKPLTPGVVQNLHSVEVRWKVLSLELLNSIFEFSQAAFRDSPDFIANGIKKYLFDVIMENGVSPITIVFRMTTNLFFHLIISFRKHLKVEIDSFFYSILLPLLDKQVSTVAQKLVVLKCLHELCKHPQIVLDMFLNYDCSINGNNILETIIRLVSKVAQRKISNNLSSEAYEQEKHLKNRALETLVCFVNSVVNWSSGFHDEIKKGIQNMFEPPQVDRDPDEYEKNKDAKTVVEKGKELFKISYKKGLEYFYANNIVKNDDESVALFLKNTPGLDKVMIGELLGALNSKDLLNKYAELFMFKGVELDFALREFLSSFWLPGEGQKVSRFMEEFSDKYHKENKEFFANPTSVYFLAMAIIMLATDLHNPSQKVKITREEWKKLLVGQDDGKDYDNDMLDKIFARIQAEELKVTDDVLTAHSTYSVGMPEKQRIVVYNLEAKVMLDRCKSDLKLKIDKDEFVKFNQVNDPYHAKLVFSITWHSILGALSQVMEETDDLHIVKQCLEGLSGCIHLSCIFNASTERETFIKTLAQLTFLENFREIKPKNVEAIKTLIESAEVNSNFLRSSWTTILKCLSSLERMHNMGSGGKNEVSREPVTNADTPKKSYHTFEEVNSTTIASQIQGLTIYRIYVNTAQLAHYAVIDFVDSLCEVSSEELANFRTFSLQKLGEVADYNMNRPLEVWTKIWNSLSQHYIEAGLNKNESASLLAADSVRQLAAKRLTIKDIEDQHSILMPFEEVISHENKQIREYIIFCIAKLMATHGDHIKGGWIVFLHAFQKTSGDIPEIVELSFEQLYEITRLHFASIIEQHFFVDFVDCVSSFACNPALGEKIGKRAIGLVKFCSQQLISGNVPEDTKNDIEDTEDKTFTLRHKREWFSIFKALSRTIQYHLINARLEAHEVLFELLNSHGASFSSSLLRTTFVEILIPLFDIVLDSIATKYIIDDSEWLITTCLKALHSVTLLFCNFFETIPDLLDNLLELLHRCINQNNESLATFGVAAFETLISSSSIKYNDEQWNSVCKFIRSLQEKLVPNDFFDRFLVSKKPNVEKKSTPPTEPKTPPPKSENSSHTPKSGKTTKRRVTKRVKALYGRIRIHNLLLKLIKDQIFDKADRGILRLSEENCFIILDSIFLSHKNIYVCIKSDQYESLIDHSIYDNLLTLQSDLIKRYLETLYYLLQETKNKSIYTSAEEKILSNTASIIRNHINDCPSLQKMSPKLKKLHSMDEDVLIYCLKSLLSFSEEIFAKHVKELYTIIIDLSLSESANVRQTLKEILVRIGTSYSINK